MAVESLADHRRTWTLIDRDGKPWESEVPGSLGGHRRTRIYGLMDCRAALLALARGGYARDRVFFLDRRDAEAAGFRPCAVCLPRVYRAWKAQGGLAAISTSGEGASGAS